MWRKVWRLGEFACDYYFDSIQHDQWEWKPHLWTSFSAGRVCNKKIQRKELTVWASGITYFLYQKAMKMQIHTVHRLETSHWNVIAKSDTRNSSPPHSPLLKRFLTKSKSRFSLRLNHPKTTTHKTEAMRSTDRNTEAHTRQQPHRLLKRSKVIFREFTKFTKQSKNTREK